MCSIEPPDGSNAADENGNNDDCFIVKLSGLDGSRLWQTYVSGAAGNDFCSAIALDDSRDVYVTGGASGTIWLGDDSSFDASEGVLDVFVVKLDGSNGTPNWSKARCAALPPPTHAPFNADTAARLCSDLRLLFGRRGHGDRGGRE